MSSPAITGYALAGAFNNTPERKREYDLYFDKLRSIYYYKYNIVKALVEGIDNITYEKEKIIDEVHNILGENAEEALKGMKYIKFPENLEPESGFFAILDFTALKGMKFRNRIISTERDLLKFFYKTYRIRFLIGQSISWPYEDELIGRISYAIDNKILVTALFNINKACNLLDGKEDYIIRFNRIEDQSQMARIKIDGWKSAYDQIIEAKYLNKMNYEELRQRYFRSFDEYKNSVLVAAKGKEILGYSCFEIKDKSVKYESELVSLIIKNDYVGMGIDNSLFLETVKQLVSQKKRNMIVWVFSQDKKTIEFYNKYGGVITEKKMILLDDKEYEKVGIYFDLEQIDNDDSF